MLIKANNRWQAFGIHIAISVVLFLIMASVIYFYWYPGFLFRYDGGLEGMKLIAGVDFFIGPVLTLCVYKIGKKSLPFDLVFIALLQLACLSGGMWTVWQTRPVAVVYAEGTIRTISYQVFVDYGVQPADVPLLQERWPVWVAVADAAVSQSNLFTQPQHDSQPHFRISGYLPFKDYLPEIAKHGLTAEKVLAGSNEAVNAISRQKPVIFFYGCAAGTGVGYLGLDPTSGAVEGFVLYTPRVTATWLGYLMQSKVTFVQFIHSLLKGG